MGGILSILSPNQSLILTPGATNHTILVSDNDGNLCVRRAVKDNITPLLESINREYQATGFFDWGGFYKIRSITKQVEFIEKCRERNLQVVAPIYFDKMTMYLPFIHGEPYQTFISTKPESEAEVIKAYLKSITDAHNQGIIYGDRWGPNTIVDRGGKLWHIDFDIHLYSPLAREFEIAQAVYYSVYHAANKEAALRECADFMHSTHFDIYHLPSVSSFLHKHIAYFGNGEYGGIQAEILGITGEI